MKRILPPEALLLGACLLLAGGCGDPDPSSGTSVGNPGMFALQAAPGDGVEVLEGTVSDPFLVARQDCSGADEEDDVLLLEDDAVELGQILDFDAGAWCGLWLEFSELELVVTLDELGPDEPVSLLLPATEAWLETSPDQAVHVSDSSSLVLELASPGWLEEEELEVDVEDKTPVEDSVLVLLAERVQDQSGLYDDDNDNLEVDSEERVNGAVMTVDPESADQTAPTPSTDNTQPQTGCSVTGASSPTARGLLLLLCLGSCARRRRLGGVQRR